MHLIVCSSRLMLKKSNVWLVNRPVLEWDNLSNFNNVDLKPSWSLSKRNKNKRPLLLLPLPRRSRAPLPVRQRQLVHTPKKSQSMVTVDTWRVNRLECLSSSLGSIGEIRQNLCAKLGWCRRFICRTNSFFVWTSVKIDRLRRSSSSRSPLCLEDSLWKSLV